MTKTTVKMILVGILSLGLVACGQGMNSSSKDTASKAGGLDTGGDNSGNSIGNGSNTGNSGNSGSGGNVGPVPFDAQKLADEVEADTQAIIDEANAAADEAEKFINRINIFGGKIDVGGVQGGASQQLVLDGIVRKALNKVGDVLEKAPGLLDNLRGKLAEKINQLDPANPLHQSAIAALMTAMQKIDQLEAKYGQLLGRVADAIDLVVPRLDLLAASVPFPASIAVMIEWPAIKQVLAEFQARLRSM